TAARLHTRPDAMHPELGSGLSFENSPGGVRVDFLMSGCPAATAGVQVGDLVVSIDGEPTRDARDAFARVRRPSGAELSLVVRREGRDLPLTIK
ncbi:MAG: PDZ domain-containing protein, partial [Myxococcota bacterium]